MTAGFSVENRGKQAYETALHSNHRPLGDVVFGWMADESDFELLAAKGTKKFKNKCIKRTVREIYEAKQKEAEDMQRM